MTAGWQTLRARRAKLPPKSAFAGTAYFIAASTDALPADLQATGSRRPPVLHVPARRRVRKPLPGSREGGEPPCPSRERHGAHNRDGTLRALLLCESRQLRSSPPGASGFVETRRTAEVSEDDPVGLPCTGSGDAACPVAG